MEESLLPTHKPVCISVPSAGTNFERTTLRQPNKVEIDVTKQQVTESSKKLKSDTQWEWTLARTQAEEQPQCINQLWAMWNEQAEEAIRSAQITFNTGRGLAAKFSVEPMAARQQDPEQGAVNKRFI